MSRNHIDISPNGEHWRVARHWANRPRFQIARWRKPDGDFLSRFWLNWLPFDESVSGLVAGLALSVAVLALIVLIVFVLLPLLGIILELGALIALIASGVLGRVFLHRPWIIEAKNLDRPDATRHFAVTGWLRSRRVIRALKDAIVGNGLLPVQLAEADAAVIESG